MDKYRYRKERKNYIPVWLALFFFFAAIAIVAIMLTAFTSMNPDPWTTRCFDGEVGEGCIYIVGCGLIINGKLLDEQGAPGMPIPPPEVTPVW